MFLYHIKPAFRSGSNWIRILLSLRDTDLDSYIVKVLDPDPDLHIEYMDPQHWFCLYATNSQTAEKFCVWLQLHRS